MFKDVNAILNKDANEHERIAKEEQDVNDLVGLYNKVSKDNFLVKTDFLQNLMKYVPPRDSKNEEEKNNEKIFNECQVCNTEIDNEKCRMVTMKQYCNHAMICEDCFQIYLKTKIKDEDVIPWLPCPAPNCLQPIHPHLLMKLDNKDLLNFSGSFIRKHLARNPNWIPCRNDKNCRYGFVVLKNDEQECTKKCERCSYSQVVSRNPIKSDQGFQEMLKIGALRLCPKCEFPTMKDKGLCNVMQCGQCGIWWNWKTREFGTNSRDLKNKARARGTLWEHGELQYQQILQRENPDEFKKLLERNGIEYDESYIRGTR